MREVGVRTSKDDEIQLFQAGVGDEEDVIYITVDQVDVLTGWLQQAKAEIMKQKQ